MNTLDFRTTIEGSVYHWYQKQGIANITDGFKISIQGKSIDDSVFLFFQLNELLHATGCSYKFATAKMIDKKIPQQSNKLLTIYVPNGVDVKSFCELVYIHLKAYKGWQDVKHPDSYEHYAGGIYYRNDRDENGVYIPARK